MRPLSQIRLAPLGLGPLSLGVACALALAPLPIAQSRAASGIPAVVASAVASAQRPETDKTRDVNRKPAEVVAFSGLKPGEKIIDFLPGTGYYSRIFSGVVGPRGHVYSFYPTELKKGQPQAGEHPFAGLDNVTALRGSVNAVKAPEPVDMVWISDNYHDLHDPPFGPADLGKVNKSVYDALKPGGIYLVLDHAAEPGSGLRDTNTRHRIDEAVVKKEVEAAGFKLIGESKVLHNPADDHQKRIFDPAIRGRTDQFILKFQKPKG
ncbi:MAG TPA: methyltransferase [Stellaceae bacterium]|jgi:predicted methyltransferase|nr:methyltransferase [Stellaceae bacterium]